MQLEPLEKRIRVEGVKTGRVTALDLPGRIQQALAAGIISETEAAALRDYDRKVMDLIHVDDFESARARHPGAAASARSSRARRMSTRRRSRRTPRRLAVASNCGAAPARTAATR